MHTTHFWNLLYLHRTKIIVLLLLVSTLLKSETTYAQGQGYIRKHLEFYDEKPIHYGFLFAMPVTRFRVQHSDEFMSTDSAFLIQSPARPNFRMGLTLNAFLTDHFDFRTGLNVSLYERSIKYSYPSSPDVTKSRESVWMELPLTVKYKSKRRANSRMYMLAGVTLGIETNVRGKNKGLAPSDRLNTSNKDLSIDYGFGFDQFFEFFKFAPELRFSHGLVNVFTPAINNADKGISKINTHTVTLLLNFE